MNNKQRLQGLLSIAIIFGPILIIPIVSPDYWGPLIGQWYQLPVPALALFGPTALLLLIVISLSQWVVVIYFIILKFIKPELDFLYEIKPYQERAAKYERGLGATIVIFIAMYFYHVVIAWYTGLDIATPKEAIEYVLEMGRGFDDDY